MALVLKSKNKGSLSTIVITIVIITAILIVIIIVVIIAKGYIIIVNYKVIVVNTIE